MSDNQESNPINGQETHFQMQQESAPEPCAQPHGAEPAEEGTAAADLQEYDGLIMPDGASVDEETMTSFKTLAREMNLSAQDAQRLLDFEADAAGRVGVGAETARQEILQRWADKTKELFGPGYAREIDVALRAADAFGGAELRELLETTGLGNHPVVVKTFNQIGRRMGEDECLGGSAAVRGSDKTFTEALYGVKSN